MFRTSPPRRHAVQEPENNYNHQTSEKRVHVDLIDCAEHNRSNGGNEEHK